MPPDDSRLNPAIVWLIVLAGTLLSLIAIHGIIIPVFCLDAFGRSTGTCGTKMPVIWLCSALFLAAAVYSGYRLAGAMRAGRER